MLITIFSATGKELYRTKLEGIQGTETRSFNVSFLPSGHYILQIVAREKETISLKFVKI